MHSCQGLSLSLFSLCLPLPCVCVCVCTPSLSQQGRGHSIGSLTHLQLINQLSLLKSPGCSLTPCLILLPPNVVSPQASDTPAVADTSGYIVCCDFCPYLVLLLAPDNPCSSSAACTCQETDPVPAAPTHPPSPHSAAVTSHATHLLPPPLPATPFTCWIPRLPCSFPTKETLTILSCCG